MRKEAIQKADNPNDCGGWISQKDKDNMISAKDKTIYCGWHTGWLCEYCEPSKCANYTPKEKESTQLTLF